MALTIGSATNARDKGGLEKLKNDFTNDLESVVRVLEATKYDQMIKIIQNNWEGADADDFIRDIKKTVKNLKTQVKALKNEIEDTLNNDYTNFIKFQQRNVK